MQRMLAHAGACHAHCSSEKVRARSAQLCTQLERLQASFQSIDLHILRYGSADLQLRVTLALHSACRLPTPHTAPLRLPNARTTRKLSMRDRTMPALHHTPRDTEASPHICGRVQDHLFDSLQSLLAAAISAASPAKEAECVHELACKVDEVHVTLQKHLRKEEEQLFPLVLAHFSLREQAELVVRPPQRR